MGIFGPEYGVFHVNSAYFEEIQFVHRVHVIFFKFQEVQNDLIKVLPSILLLFPVFNSKGAIPTHIWNGVLSWTPSILLLLPVIKNRRGAVPADIWNCVLS